MKDLILSQLEMFVGFVKFHKTKKLLLKSKRAIKFKPLRKLSFAYQVYLVPALSIALLLTALVSFTDIFVSAEKIENYEKIQSLKVSENIKSWPVSITGMSVEFKERLIKLINTYLITFVAVVVFYPSSIIYKKIVIWNQRESSFYNEKSDLLFLYITAIRFFSISIFYYLFLAYTRYINIYKDEIESLIPIQLLLVRSVGVLLYCIAFFYPLYLTYKTEKEIRAQLNLKNTLSHFIVSSSYYCLFFLYTFIGFMVNFFISRI